MARASIDSLIHLAERKVGCILGSLQQDKDDDALQATRTARQVLGRIERRLERGEYAGSRKANMRRRGNIIDISEGG